MNGGIQIPRRTSTPQSLKKTQIDGIKTNFKKVSDKQDQNISQINDVVVEIFRSYKNNSFKNDKNLNLLKSVFLLRNMARKNGEFIRLLSDNKEISQKTIREQIDNILGDQNFQKKVLEERNQLTENIKKKYSFSEVKADICTIVQDLIDEVSKEIKTNSNKEEQQQEKQQQERDKTSREHTKDINQERKPSEKQENPGEISVKDYKNSIASNVIDSMFGVVEKLFKANSEKQVEKQLISELNTDSKRKNIQIQDKISKNIQNTSNVQSEKSIQRKIMNTALNQSERVKIKDNTKKNKNIFKTSFDDIGKFSRKGLGRIQKTLLWTAVGIRRANSKGLFSLGTLWKKGGAASVGAVASFGLMIPFNIVGFLASGIFKISKMIIGGLWKFSVGIVKAVASGISNLYKILVKPLLPYIFKVLMTPQGAFIAGYITGFVCDKFKKDFGFGEYETNDFSNGILKTTKRFINRIKDFIKNIDIEEINRNIVYFGSTFIFPILRKVLEGFLPKNLAIRGLKSIGGKALGWATYSGAIMSAVKTAASTTLRSIPFLWPIALAAGAFVVMSNELSDIIEHVKSTIDEKVTGRHYVEKFNQFKDRLKRTKKTKLGGFRDKNKNLIMKVTKSGYRSSETDYFDVNSVLRDVIENGKNVEWKAQASEKINKFCSEQMAILENERKSIVNAPKIGSMISSQRQMEYEILINYNGRKYRTDTLPKEIQNPIELRTRNLLARLKLLEKLRRRGFSTEEGLIQWEDEIQRYNDAVDNLVVINGNVGDIDENSLGEKLKLYTINQKDIHNAGPHNTVAGWEVLKKGAYYGYQENTGKVNWRSGTDVEQTLNYTIGQIVSQAKPEEKTGVYEATETSLQFVGNTVHELTDNDKKNGRAEDILITKTHFLEMCAIVSDMFCETPSNITASSFISPRPPMEEFQKIMSSKRLERAFKRNIQAYKKKYGFEKYPFDPQNAKMLQFFRMLMEQSEMFKKKFGEIVSNFVQGYIIESVPDMRIVSFKTKPSSDQEIFGFTPNPNEEFVLYRRVSYSKYYWEKHGDKMNYTFDPRNNPNPPEFKSGNYYCGIATLEDRQECTSKEFHYTTGFSFKMNFRKELHNSIIDMMSGRFLDFTMPFFAKFKDMEDLEKKGEKIQTDSSKSNPIDEIMSSLDSGIQNIDNLMRQARKKTILSDYEVEQIQQQKTEQMKEIQEKMQKFRQHYKERSEQSKQIINKATGVDKDGEKQEGTAAVARNNKETNQAKIGARTRFIEDNSSGHINV